MLGINQKHYDTETTRTVPCNLNKCRDNKSSFYNRSGDIIWTQITLHLIAKRMQFVLKILFRFHFFWSFVTWDQACTQKKVPKRHSSSKITAREDISMAAETRWRMSESLTRTIADRKKLNEWLIASETCIYRRDSTSCLLNNPDHDMIGSNENTMLAGEKFSDDQQCELVFGSGARICSYMPKCSRLWCSQNHKEDNGCRTQHMPWADGTTCGESEWCQKGECVTRNRSALAPIHGNWGAWSE